MKTTSPSGVEDEGGHDAGDIQKLVCRLRGNGARNCVVDCCDGNLVAVEPRSLNDLIADDRCVQIVLEQLHYIDCVRTHAAQECRRFEGARAGAHGEFFSYRARCPQAALRFNRADVALLNRVLQKLGHKLGRRRGKRLVQIQHNLLDIIRRAPVMVNDSDTGNRFQQRARLNLIGAVRIDDNQKTLRIRL